VDARANLPFAQAVNLRSEIRSELPTRGIAVAPIDCCAESFVMTCDVFGTANAAALITFFAGKSAPFRTLINYMGVQNESTPRADDLATNWVTDYVLVAAIGAACYGLGVVA
jgi:hypothetical protein